MRQVVCRIAALQAGGTNEASSRSHSHHRLPQPGHSSTSFRCHPTRSHSWQPERDGTAKPDLPLIHRPQRAWQLRNFARVGVPRARDTKPNRPRWHRGPELRRERACHRGQHEPCERPRGSGTVRRRLLPPAREVGPRSLHSSDRQNVVYAATPGSVSMPMCWNRVCMTMRRFS